MIIIILGILFFILFVLSVYGIFKSDKEMFLEEHKEK